MAFETEFDGQTDFSDFLERFRMQEIPASDGASAKSSYDGKKQLNAVSRQAQYDKSFEKLEAKIHELEERFEASAAQNDKILSELALTRQAMEKQKDKDAFVAGLAETINNLKASVETLSRAQTARVLGFDQAPEVNRGFDDKAPAFVPAQVPQEAPQTQEKERLEREEKERLISSLHQKASQLKAVNSALDREIKKVQQEKMEALKKSAEQAKEILSLREQLTAAEERFKSFDFEGRIISVKQQYQQKVSSLETQLHEISNVCMKQVEEIESLKAENLKLHNIANEKAELTAQYEAKTKELESVRASMASMEEAHAGKAKKQLSIFGSRIQTLEQERDTLAAKLEEVQQRLDTVLREKQTLEANFKELLEKINRNDAVIEELKQKIEVLTAENVHLTDERTALQTANADLSRRADELSKNNEALLKNQAALAGVNEELARKTQELNQASEALLREQQAHADLSRRADALNENNEALRKNQAALAGVNEELSRKTQELNQANEALLREQTAHADLSRRADELNENNEALRKNQAALAGVNEELSRKTQELNQANEALLREQTALSREKDSLSRQKENWTKERELLEHQKQMLVQEKELLIKQKKELEQEKESLARENKALRAQPPHKSAAPVAPMVHLPKSPAPAKPEASAVPLNETPVEVKETLKPKVRSEEDLPEIKVAKPMAQDDFGPGGDFLEKTDSFIGRMKWSIFREDK